MAKTRNWFGLVTVALVGAALVGCGGEAPVAPVAPTPAPMPPIPPISAEAGVPVTLAAEQNFERTRQLASTRNFGRRSDPWMLLASESAFERAQQNERVAQDFGGWFGRQFEEPDTSAQEAAQVVEPQPYRRLSGILLGNGVSALIEMEDGRVFEILPGTQIPGTPWVVISIDSERAILRRGGSRLPKQIEVLLGPSVGTMTGGAAGGGGGAPQGGGGGRDGEDSPDGGAAGPRRPGPGSR